MASMAVLLLIAMVVTTVDATSEEPLADGPLGDMPDDAGPEPGCARWVDWPLFCGWQETLLSDWREHRRPGAGVVIIVTGRKNTGKDFLASEVIEPLLSALQLSVAVESISAAFKTEAAALLGLDLDRLLHDREYKEAHRPQLLELLSRKRQSDANFDENNFLGIVDRSDADVLVLTGLREATLSSKHYSSLAHRQVVVVKLTNQKSDAQPDPAEDSVDAITDCVEVANSKDGAEGLSNAFSATAMPPLLDAVGVSMERADPNKSLRERIMAIPDFPRAGVLFRDVKGFLSGPGVPLPPIDDAITTIVTCESGGVVFAEKLAAFWGLGPPVVIRKVRAEDADGGMVTFGGSFVSGVRTTFALEPFIVLPSRGVLFVDDVLSSGETALAVGRLLRRAGVGGTKAWFVAEFLGHQRDPALNELFAEMTSMVKFEGT